MTARKTKKCGEPEASELIKFSYSYEQNQLESDILEKN